MFYKGSKKGFSLIELMVVIAIIALLSMISIPHFLKFLSKSKRTEAYVQLRALYLEEKAYFSEHGAYTNIIGDQGLSFKPDGALLYTYGFAGTAGKNYILGTLNTPASALKDTKVSGNSFVIAAAGDIDNDGNPDVLTIDQTGTIKIVQDDLTQ